MKMDARMPELPPMPKLLPEVHACKHRLVRRQIAVTASGVKRYAVVCELTHPDKIVVAHMGQATAEITISRPGMPTLCKVPPKCRRRCSRSGAGCWCSSEA